MLWLAVAYVAASYAAVMLVPTIRTLRMLAFVTIAGALYVAVYLLHPPYQLPAQIVIVLATFGAAVFAERLGLASLSLEAMALDQDTREAVETVAADPTVAAERFAELDERAERLEPAWAVAVRLLRQTAIRRSPVHEPRIELGTRAAAFEAAGRHYWYEARRGRRLPRRRFVTLADEDAALRSYLEEFRNAVPEEALTTRLVELGPWADAASKLVDDMAEIPLRDRQTQRLREELVRLLRFELEIATGDHSEQAVRKYEQAKQAIGARWDELERYLGPSATRAGS